MTIFLTILITLFITIIILNLKSTGKRIEHYISAKGALNSEEVLRSIGELLGPPLIKGNRITHLANGDCIFSSMLDAIRSAKKTITFETFIYWSGSIGKEFSDTLSEKAKSGVKVHVILDWIGSRNMKFSAIEEMINAGVMVERYHPIRWYNITRINNRTHRKILVIDGRIGFTGGVGVADQWLGNAQDEMHWRDSHFKIEGPVVAQLQSAFMDNWNSTNAEVLHGNDYFPEIIPIGNSVAQVFKSSPQEGSGSVRLMYLYSIMHAKKSIQIANAYFVPDSHMRKVLIEASRRGVEIEVIVPGKNIDTEITRKASINNWGELLEAGIKIYQYDHTMFHCKYMIVDNIWGSVGSTNMDNRSFRLNSECNLNVVEESWANEMKLIFNKDKTNATIYTIEKWNNRPIHQKMLASLASLIRHQV